MVLNQPFTGFSDPPSPVDEETHIPDADGDTVVEAQQQQPGNASGYSRVNNGDDASIFTTFTVQPPPSLGRRSIFSEHLHEDDEVYDPKNKEPKDEPSRPLRYNWRPFFLLLFYIPVLVIPWVLTCILAYHPLNASSYYIQAGGLSPDQVSSVSSTIIAIRVLNSVASVATIPVIGAVLAQAAVVYTQKRKSDQSLTLRQTLALADRGWGDIGVLWDALRGDRGRAGAASLFLWFAALLIVIGAVQQPLQQLLVRFDDTLVLTSQDNSTSNHISGYDPEPSDLEKMPQGLGVSEVAASLGTASDQEIFSQIWPEYTGADNATAVKSADSQTFRWYSHDNQTAGLNRTYFVSALPNGTTTGVLRQHAMRFNSSVKCEHVSGIPSPCSGSRPFEASLSMPGVLNISLCAPGAYGESPWNLSRNRQDITEHLYLDVYVPCSKDIIQNRNQAANFTLRCTSNTTRGYFELGNYRNNYTHGPLLETWPTPENMSKNYNDKLRGTLGDRPTELDHGRYNRTGWDVDSLPDPFGTRNLNMSGPLMTSALAMFGNQSFFHLAANHTNATSIRTKTEICKYYSLPLARLLPQWHDDFQHFCGDADSEKQPRGALAQLVNGWVFNFNDTDGAEQAFEAGMFFATKALLTQTVDATRAWGAREIQSAPGAMVIKPNVSLAVIIVISIIIFLQICGLAYAVWYIYQVRTWTVTLNGTAMARVGAGMDKSEMPPMGMLMRKDLDTLNDVDGLVGVVERRADSGGDPPLKLGAPGVISKKT
ncbi:uncharacterized protein K452DRAFT_299507 [Aplosporella prunicola CBS 121167]|uniref:Uncharacterized protein n=1 Tax=Aplosporella prunicola CBS 121167 TaxID=1176127 RepID=A0A6A6B964_9PEZI|nr:uncharacterized protein K452DRAFT_299507 [Aplosporella prunicola CBS 121167]KAF2140108.1 hypothetical protein K452DRAFT_299507 [Aplosporella prunicola CBS 121167]